MISQKKLRFFVAVFFLGLTFNLSCPPKLRAGQNGRRNIAPTFPPGCVPAAIKIKNLFFDAVKKNLETGVAVNIEILRRDGSVVVDEEERNNLIIAKLMVDYKNVAFDAATYVGAEKNRKLQGLFNSLSFFMGAKFAANLKKTHSLGKLASLINESHTQATVQEAFYQGFDEKDLTKKSLGILSLLDLAFAAGMQLREFFEEDKIPCEKVIREELEIVRVAAQKEIDAAVEADLVLRAAEALRAKELEAIRKREVHEKAEAEHQYRIELAIKRVSFSGLKDLLIARKKRSKMLSSYRAVMLEMKELKDQQIAIEKDLQKKLVEEKILYSFAKYKEVKTKERVTQELLEAENQELQELLRKAEASLEALAQEKLLQELSAVERIALAEKQHAESQTQLALIKEQHQAELRAKRKRLKKQRNASKRRRAQEARRMAQKVLQEKQHSSVQERMSIYYSNQPFFPIVPPPPGLGYGPLAVPGYYHSHSYFQHREGAVLGEEIPLDYRYGYNRAIINGCAEHEKFKLAGGAGQDPLPLLVRSSILELQSLEDELGDAEDFPGLEVVRGELDAYSFLLKKRTEIFNEAAGVDNPFLIREKIRGDSSFSPLSYAFFEGILLCAFKLRMEDKKLKMDEKKLKADSVASADDAGAPAGAGHA